jgi:hypothetical protein
VCLRAHDAHLRQRARGAGPGRLSERCAPPRGAGPA